MASTNLPKAYQGKCSLPLATLPNSASPVLLADETSILNAYRPRAIASAGIVLTNDGRWSEGADRTATFTQDTPTAHCALARATPYQPKLPAPKWRTISDIDVPRFGEHTLLAACENVAQVACGFNRDMESQLFRVKQPVSGPLLRGSSTERWPRRQP